MLQYFFLCISFFTILPIFARDESNSKSSDSIKLQYSKHCLPQSEGPHILTWEEKTENSIIKGEMQISTMPPQPEGYTVELPKQASMKEFTLKTKLLDGKELNCKINPSKNITIDIGAVFVLHRTNTCVCIQ